MALTSAGQIFLASAAVFLAAAYWVGRRFSRRMSPGQGTSKFIVLVAFVMISLFVPFTWWTAQALYGFATKPIYDATVVGHTSEYRDYEHKDSSGRTVRGKRLMHTAQLRFIGPEGTPLELSNSVASGDEPVDGERIRVVYAPGDRVATEFSVRSVGLWLGACVMLFILGYCLWAMVLYGSGRPMGGMRDLGVAFLFRFLLPVCTSLMALAMGYTAFKYFVLGNPDGHPLWVACICVLFTLSLLPLLVLLFRPGKTA